jgi:phage anti-repressor protein
LKDAYFEIVQELKNWLAERLTNYQYSKDDIFSKVDDIHYKFTDREKEGMAIVKEMLDRISANVLLSGP